ncbi:MAG: NAD(P)H-dependent oxidoreductase subunit E, partial [Acidihalobacter sp.]
MASVHPMRRRLRPHPKGRQIDPQAAAEVRDLTDGLPRERAWLIEHLHRLQDHFGHLPGDHLVALARELDMAPVEVYEVASFYHHFDIVAHGEAAPPAVTVRVCDSVTCALFGAEDLARTLEQRLGSEVRVQRVSCVGRCDRAPVALVGQNPVTYADADKVTETVARGETSARPPDARGYRAYRNNGGYALCRALERGELSAESVLQAIEGAGLRGLGGAGFPTARKWHILLDQPAPRIIAINIDEGEPGTFKDLHYLSRDPHRFLEGALIAAQVIGADDIYIYLRDEYAGARRMLEHELAALQADPPCRLPNLYLRRGAGAYICGEESAMIESIEGKRGMPRLRPPFVAQNGVFGRPTLEHNMETLHWVRDIVEKGAEWFASQGRHGRHGLRSYSVSGRITEPGVKLAPAGITVRELIDEYCGGMLPGHTFYAYFPGGASGGILPASLGDIPLDFGTMEEHGCFIGSAAIIVLSDHDRARDAAFNAMRFFAHESCGKCTPCRVGTAKAADLMTEPRWDRGRLDDLAQVMADASICGLGQAAP